MNFGDTRLPERFWKKCIPEPNSGCWLWVAATSRLGYGNFGWNGRVTEPHRVSYLTLVGPIPEGLELDHKCRIRCCVNPDHLEAVTHRENCRRAVNWLSAITHCPQGHPYDTANTRMYRNKRHCRACARAKMKARYWARREQAA